MRRPGSQHRSYPQGATDIGVVGGGVVGMAIALELIARRARVTLYEKKDECGHGASGASAAMLAPAGEAALKDRWFFDACLCGAELWRSLASELERYGGTGADFSGGFVCAHTSDQQAALARMVAACHAHGVEAREMSSRAARVREPSLSEELRAIVFVPGDGQLDPPATMRALRAALLARGADVKTRAPVRTINRCADGRLHVHGGGVHEILVWAAGHDSAGEIMLDGAAYRPAPLVRPVKGQIVAVRATHGAPVHMLRCGHGYIAPKAGRVLVGATSDWDRSDTVPDPATSDALLADMARVAPIIADLPRLDHWAGVRPGSPDGVPLVGWSGVDGLYLATGHFRNGVLLAPVTARIAAAAVTGGPPHPLAQKMSPERLAPARQVGRG